jgi:hypothetical protein
MLEILPINDKYLQFIKIKDLNRKTPIVRVKNKTNGFFLGEIKWYSAWRDYCFFPAENCVFHDGCLNKIVECINYLKTK